MLIYIDNAAEITRKNVLFLPYTSFYSVLFFKSADMGKDNYT